MRLREMAVVYRVNNTRLRLRGPRIALRESGDEEERLRRRMAAQAPVYREGPETAPLLERYYGEGEGLL